MPICVMILNGPNLNMLGVREPHIYGSVTLAAVEESCRELAALIDVSLDFRQSNSEGEMVEWLQDARGSVDAIIINPAGFSFYSVAILDALRMFEGPIIELHISNIHARDAVHRHSIMSAGVKAVICGLGVYGYIVALQSAARFLDALPDTLPAPLRVGPD
ncbi:MAG TPA: type II 3-dehydroquinate dehydratase [Alphaproteobacteria bacterium]|nr:type II 3-dehydroquinate dehydratase [Alphaproteobacteria bacterium]